MMKPLFLLAIASLIFAFTSSALAEENAWEIYPDGYWKLTGVEVTPNYPDVEYTAVEGEVSSTREVTCEDQDTYAKTPASGTTYARHNIFPNQAEDGSEFTVTISMGAISTCKPGDVVINSYHGLDFQAVNYVHGRPMSSDYVDLNHDLGHFDIPRNWGLENSDDYTYTFPSFTEAWMVQRRIDGVPGQITPEEMAAAASVPGKYAFEYVLAFKNRGGSANVTYKYAWIPKGAEGATFTGRVTDFDGRPLAYAKLQVLYDGTRYDEVTGPDGSYSITIPTLDLESQKEVEMSVYLVYFREDTTYFTISDAKSGWIVHMKKTFTPSAPEDLVQDFDFGFAFKDNYNLAGTSAVAGDGVKYSSRATLRTLRDAAAIYYNLHDAVDVYLTILNTNLDYKLPVDVTINSAQGSQYLKADSDLVLSEQHTPYNSVHRRFVEQHEFSHHAMYAQYGASWPEGRDLPDMKNHGGYLNPSSADSFTEGFAEFMTLVIASYGNVPSPEYYSDKGSFENNLRVWSNRGKMEEYAVATLLWDLYDDHNDKGDTITLTMPQIWSVLKTKRKDFQAYYTAFIDAFPDKKAQIAAVFVEHGFFADKNAGNGVRDGFEPFRDTISNGANKGVYNPGEYFVDYGAYETGRNMFFDPGEEVGRSTQYTRPSRGYDDYIPDAFLKVSDTEADLYTVSVHFNDPQEGQDYSYTVDRRQGTVYIMPLPEEVDATITVRPAQGYTAQNTYTITNEEYQTKYYASEGKGYFDEHTFGLTGTGPAEKYWPGGVEPPLLPDGGYDNEGSVEVKLDELSGTPGTPSGSGVPQSSVPGSQSAVSGSPSSPGNVPLPPGQPSGGDNTALIIVVVAVGLVLALVIAVVMIRKPRGAAPPAPSPPAQSAPPVQYISYVQSAPPAQPAGPATFCENCGYRVETNEKFCRKCGVEK